MTVLPEGWRSVRLGDVADTALGKMLDAARPKGTTRVPYLRNVNVQWGHVDLDDVSEVPLSDDELQRFALADGDLLVCEGGDVGRAAIWHGGRGYMAYQKALHRVRAGSDLDLKFLRYLLEHYAVTGELRERATGSTILHLPQQRLRELPIPLPPVDEQRRIVDILEDHLSSLDAASQSLRTAALRAGSLQTSIISNELAAAGGAHMTLSEVATSVRNGIFVSRAKPIGRGVPILRIGAVRPLALDLTDLRYSERDAADLAAEGFLLSPGDLVFTRYNGNPAYVGACAVVPAIDGPLTYPDKVIRVVVDRTLANPEFVALACAVSEGRSRIRAFVKTTAGQAGISGRDLRAVSIRVPSLSVQERLAQTVSVYLDAVKTLRVAVTNVSDHAFALRRSLLRAAFAGQLTSRIRPDDLAEELARV